MSLAIVPEDMSNEQLSRLALNFYDWAFLLGHRVTFKAFSQQFCRGSTVDTANRLWDRRKGEWRRLGITYKSTRTMSDHVRAKETLEFPSTQWMFDVVDELIGEARFYRRHLSNKQKRELKAWRLTSTH